MGEKLFKLSLLRDADEEKLPGERKVAVRVEKGGLAGMQPKTQSGGEHVAIGRSEDLWEEDT